MNADEMLAKTQDMVKAAADLGGRSGFRDFEIGWDDDDNPTDWYVKATFSKGAVEEHGPHPALAAWNWCVRVLTGARCRCGKLVALDDTGLAVAYPDVTMADGSRWTAQQAYDAGQCRWELKGDRWEPSCDVPSIKLNKRF